MRARIRDTEIFFDIDGASLVPEKAGIKERPTAFLIHGGPGTDHVGWKERYPALTDRLQVIYFDHRGQGRSERGDPDKYTLNENVEDMEALRKHLGLGPIVSIGGSYGGMVAMAHAARYPNSVSHLILACTSSHSGNLARAREMVAERGTPDQVSQYNDLLAGRVDTLEKMRRYFEVMGPLYSRKFERATGVGLGSGILEPVALNAAYKPGGFLRNFDLRPELHAITAPTLIIAGRHDWICPPEYSEEIHQFIPHSDLRVFEESSHSIGGDEPQGFIDAIFGFLVYQANGRRTSHAI